MRTPKMQARERHMLWGLVKKENCRSYTTQAESSSAVFFENILLRQRRQFVEIPAKDLRAI
ncbi:MAG TPA: hypothetical protein DCL60_00860, partial [Armatimonadetes bacterium]|nr:hypothetical protein [Armatimonadota bacterium]